ncbi:GAF domain-containing protein [Arthrobacter subterraneus]|uniref:GAF domain-containing protein n=1 Tax=Arthrobacter subterraneus TaxID=335973 RepID=A0A1G8DM13_9MICC|nr:GAF and ANTAR domain-containing protein [Arthrobacter subterraneus]SDH58753.1 GAF domain-containing protein [Arthrobacter subterraneus]
MNRKAPLDELSAAVGRIMGLLLTEEKVNDAVLHLAQGIRQAIPGSIGAGVSLLDVRGNRTSTGFTDEVVAEADRLQYELRQGPCLTAWASEMSIIVPDVATDRRWPEWSSAVWGLPIRSVLSAPLMVGQHALGALKVYADAPNIYDDGTARLLEQFTAPAAILLSHIQGTETVKQISGGLQAALYSRDLVNRACGILLARGSGTAEQALSELMTMARTQQKSLIDVCTDLVAGTAADGR